MREQGGEPGGASPFSIMPFGSIFEQIFSGAGMRSRSLAYDPETGQWVDITDEFPDEEVPTDKRQDDDAVKDKDLNPEPRRRPQQQSTRQTGMAGPLGGLFEAALAAMTRTAGAEGQAPAVHHEDFEEALQRIRSSRLAASGIA